MEWVETTGKTVEEAKDLALDQLGVDEVDAEFEIMEEPRPGLFGRTRGEARVRARVRPTRPRAKVERRDRRRKSGDKAESTEKNDRAAKTADNEQADKPSRATTSNDDRAPGRRAKTTPKAKAVAAETTASTSEKTETSVNDQNNTPTVADVTAEAEKFLHGILDALGLEGTTAVHLDGDDIEVTVDGDNLGVLIGPRGTTLLAVQDLVRVASQRRIGDHNTRLRLDISGYREKRRAALARFALEQADAVGESGEERVLEPMPSADRKVIHDALSGRTDVVTRSAGEEPRRRVVIAPASSAE